MGETDQYIDYRGEEPPRKDHPPLAVGVIVAIALSLPGWGIVAAWGPLNRWWFGPQWRPDAQEGIGIGFAAAGFQLLILVAGTVIIVGDLTPVRRPLMIATGIGMVASFPLSFVCCCVTA